MYMSWESKILDEKDYPREDRGPWLFMHAQKHWRSNFSTFLLSPSTACLPFESEEGEEYVTPCSENTAGSWRGRESAPTRHCTSCTLSQAKTLQGVEAVAFILQIGKLSSDEVKWVARGYEGNVVVESGSELDCLRTDPHHTGTIMQVWYMVKTRP